MRIANLLPAGYVEGFDPPAELVPDGVSVETVSMELPALPGSAADLLLTDVATVEAAIRAEADGFDAVFVNSVADYGLRGIRSAVRIPAVGAGQASMLLALGLGDRFSIVSVLSPALREAHTAQLRQYGLTDRCASMRFVTSEQEMAEIAEEDSWYVRMRARREDMVQRIGLAVRAAVEEDGADAVVLGCTCMAPVAGDVAAYTRAPVINPLAAVYLHTELLVRIGLAHSPTSHRPVDASRRDAFTAMVRAAQGPVMAQLAGAEDCEVCVTLEEPAAVNG